MHLSLYTSSILGGLYHGKNLLSLVHGKAIYLYRSCYWVKKDAKILELCPKCVLQDAGKNNFIEIQN